MGKIQRNQAGFTLVEGLLVVFVVAVVGFAGYFVWSSQNNDEELVKKDTKTSETTHTPKYLTVTEWGVRLPLGTETSMMTYKVSSDGSDQSIDLSIPESMCEPMATIIRGEATDDDPSTNPDGGGTTTTFASNPDSVQAGGYYYSLVQGNGQYCFKDEADKEVAGGASTATVGAKTDTVRSELSNAFKNLKAK